MNFHSHLFRVSLISIDRIFDDSSVQRNCIRKFIYAVPLASSKPYNLQGIAYYETFV